MKLLIQVRKDVVGEIMKAVTNQIDHHHMGPFGQVEDGRRGCFSDRTLCGGPQHDDRQAILEQLSLFKLPR